ncbi:MAG: putative ATPase [Flavobacteriaceae bacterium]|jgi:predicted ATPase
MIYLKEVKNILRPKYFGGEEWQMKGLKPITLVVGKNGSGKTTLLDAFRAKIRELVVPPEGLDFITMSEVIENTLTVTVDKISAERGGSYESNGNIYTALGNPNDLFNRRQGSTARDFRSEVASRYDKLMAHISHNDSETSERPSKRVEKIVDLLNELVPKKYMVIKAGSSFQIVQKNNKDVAIPFNSLSSGEIEMFTLGLECLIVANWEKQGDGEHLKILLIDEPDVHIHPDLQSRFLKFLLDLSDEYDMQIIICTHSTVFIASLPEDADASIIWMDGEDDELVARTKRKSINELSALLGGNMVMQVLLNHKIILVEGDDDLVVFNQAVKSSNGIFLAYTHQCVGKDEMRKIETSIGKIMKSLCDRDDEAGILISIRDSDGEHPEIDNRPFVHRYKLQCHEIENMILSNDFLAKYEKTIDDIVFDGDRIKDDIKGNISILLIDITGTADTNWQREVGKILGGLLKENEKKDDFDAVDEFSIINFFGIELIKNLKS